MKESQEKEIKITQSTKKKGGSPLEIKEGGLGDGCKR